MISRAEQSFRAKRLESIKYRLKENITPSEQKLKTFLENSGLKFTFQKGTWSTGKNRIVDFFLPRPFLVCIEVDGPYHNNPEQKLKDDLREKEITSKFSRFSFIRFTDKEVFSERFCDIFIGRLRSTVTRKQTQSPYAIHILNRLSLGRSAA